MTEENTSTPASAPAAEHTTQASAPAEHHQEHYEQPADSPEHENYEEQGHDDHDHEGEQPDRPKKLSGAQRAKQQKEWLQNELRAREERIEALERHISERETSDRQTESERRAEAQRKKDEAHLERVKGAKGTISDWHRVMQKMDGVAVRVDVIEEIKSSDKSELLAYHLANHPEKIQKLNSMSPTELAREIGRLEATLKLPQGKKQTSAPPPPTNLGGGANPHRALEKVDDMKEFSKRLLQDLAKRSGRNGEKR